ncbi:protein of unknown function [Micromonospora pattaloongensis]|uniref:DUF397 domain-containing protein n=1 Tax=Micromonospora pattaloongensis TaxID=405436 RepID=A0A1H3HI06_9ACTN|nr:DUF397 domain-containing protein [Micromonospora pattaloongensis]SDY15173.1 protein of unknown function [Micromonospora pattaloongensis]
MEWRKSSKSNSDGNCVEVAAPGDTTVMVRDSKDKTGPVLAFNTDAWTSFVAAMKSGR